MENHHPMSAPENNKPEPTQAKDKPNKAKSKHESFTPLGSVRDYFTVQMEEDASWHSHRR